MVKLKEGPMRCLVGKTRRDPWGIQVGVEWSNGGPGLAQVFELGGRVSSAGFDLPVSLYGPPVRFPDGRW